MKQLFIVLFIVAVVFSGSSRDRVHIITSKGVYETCEDMWFKLIAFDDSTMRVSDCSHTAYLEILNPEDSVVWKEKYRMTNGMSDGHVYVGENWKSGEYRMSVYTHGSLGHGDTVVYPKRLLIVNNLPEVPDFLRSAKERIQYIEIPDSAVKDRLTVTVTLDSAVYNPRSMVRATVKVKDADGNPVNAIIAMSVADALYSYPLADVDMKSEIYGIKHDSVRYRNRFFEPVLSDAVVSGHLKSTNKRNTISLADQYINVFDDMAQKGKLNITNTGIDGYFDLSPEIGSSLGRTLLLKPLVAEEMKPKLEFDDQFKIIEEIRRGAKERYYPVIKRREEAEPMIDSTDYSARRSVQLDEIVVKKRGNRYPKRNKVMGYLDSLALNLETAWICGCRSGAGQGGTFLNDYIEGYTHHPGGSGHPKKIGKPQRGVMYELIKYSGPTMKDYVVDIRYLEYTGPRYSEEELLRMNGLWKTEGYYPRHRFQIPAEEERIIGEEDFRNTLLWLPRAQTDANGEYSILIPTSDVKSTYRCQVYVITDDVEDITSVTEFFTVR